MKFIKFIKNNKYFIYSAVIMLIIIFLLKEYILYRLELPFDYNFIK